MKVLYRLAFAGVALVFAANVLAAGTAANTQLQNTVGVTWDSPATTGGTYSTSASVTITIDLLAATPALVLESSSPTPLTAIAEGQMVTLNYRVTSNANGPDDYKLESAETPDANLGASTIAALTDVGFLGATTVGEATTIVATCIAGGGAGTCTIKVPNDNGNTGQVNYLFDADTIVFGSGQVCTVISVNDAGEGNPTDFAGTLGTDFSQIEFDDCDVGGAIALFESVYERLIVPVTITMGNLTSSPTPGSTTVATTARDDADVAAASTAVNTLINVLASNVDIYKFVRNLTQSAMTGTAGAAPGDELDIDGGGTDFWKAGITAKPGDELEYAVVLVSTAADVENVAISDPLTVFASAITNADTCAAGACTDYHDGVGVAVYKDVTLGSTACDSASGFTCLVSVLGSVTETDDSLTTTNDVGGYNSSTVVAYPGTGGDEATTLGGAIAAGKASIVLYTVKIQ